MQQIRPEDLVILDIETAPVSFIGWCPRQPNDNLVPVGADTNR